MIADMTPTCELFSGH